MIRTFDQFIDECDRAGIGLDPNISVAAGQGMTNDPTLQGTQGWQYAPRYFPEYIAVAEAGRLLRESPGKPICKNPIDARKLQGSNVGLVTLGRMMNASLVPVRLSGDAREAEFTSRGMPSLDTCQPAEEHFANTFAQILTPESDDKLGYQVFYGRKRAALLRKSAGVSSTMSLQPVVINGIPYPEGSLFRVEAANDELLGRYKVVEGCRIPSIPDKLRATERLATVQNKIAFLRLSSFALTPEDRHTFGLGASAWEDHRAREVFRMPLTAIRKGIERRLPVKH